MRQYVHPIEALKTDTRSKLVDGLVPAVILCLMWLVIALSVYPIDAVFGLPGLLVYVLGLLAVAMYSLQWALDRKHSETTRAWFGIAGGFVAWATISVSARMGHPVDSTAGVVSLILCGMIVWLFWRSVLPVGGRFFSLTFLLNWVETFAIGLQGRLTAFSPVFTVLYRATGYFAILLAVLALLWILFASRRRLERISAALALWFFVSLAIFIFRGAVF